MLKASRNCKALNNGAVLVLAVSVIRVRSASHNGCAWKKRDLAPLFFRTHYRRCWCNRFWIPALSSIIQQRNLRLLRLCMRINACLLLHAAYYITVISRSHRTIRYAFGTDNVRTVLYVISFIAHNVQACVFLKLFIARIWVIKATPLCTHMTTTGNIKHYKIRALY